MVQTLMDDSSALIGYCQTYSPEGRLAVGFNTGCVNIFSVLDGDEPREFQKPIVFKAQDSAIFSMISYNNLLITAGSNGVIKCWKWDDILNGKYVSISSLRIPQIDWEVEYEINKIAISDKNHSPLLIAAAGDNKVYAFNMENSKCTITLEGHTDYVHDLKVYNEGNCLATASEDGTVRLWDIRSKSVQNIIEPNKKTNIKRSQPWLSCLDVCNDNEWLVCGGGPKLSLWSLRSMGNMCVFDSEKPQQNDVLFYNSKIVSVGLSNQITKWNLNGKIEATTKTSIGNIMNICKLDEKMLSVSGYGSKVDLFTKFAYRDISFKCQSCK